MHHTPKHCTERSRAKVGRFSVCCLVGCLLWPATYTMAAEPISTKSLLGEMIDTARLGNFPDPAYKTVQFSSYDRRSTLPGGPGWFANSDGFGNEPTPNFEAVLEEPEGDKPGRYLICDVPGPGAIVRTWSAAIEGTLRVVLDDADEPLFEGPANEFLQGGLQQLVLQTGMDAKLYQRTYRQRDACYFPIPFAQRCRIEWTANHRRIHFYEVQIRQYAATAHVVSLTKRQIPDLASTIQQVAQVLADPTGQWHYHTELDPISVNCDLPAGKTADLLAIAGPQAIESLTLRVAAEDVDLALRQTVLLINFDGHASDQVQCPVGDFFGSAPGINPYNEVPLSVERDGTMTCRFVMPFAKKCSMRLANMGQQPVTVQGTVRPMPWTWDDARSMHLRARWRVDHDLVADGGDHAQDLPFLLAQGQGVYVGTAVMLLNPNPIPTPYGNWWGEGDEKIFVDEDVRPSTFGTGSEDYFNYSWSSPDIFLYPYCGQPRNDGPANRGFVTNQRWHILDALPFQHRLAFYMELMSHERTPNFSYARLAYHYGRPGIVDDFVNLTGEDVRPLLYPANWQPAARFGAQHSTFFQAEQVCRNRDQFKLVPGNRWAEGQLLTWQPSEQGDELVFELPVEQTGKYGIHVTAQLGPTGARLLATLDGKPLPFGPGDGAIDAKTDYRVLLRDFESPNVELTQGPHRVAFRIVPEANSASPTNEHPAVGIDFLWLQQR